MRTRGPPGGGGGRDRYTTIVAVITKTVTAEEDATGTTAMTTVAAEVATQPGPLPQPRLQASQGCSCCITKHMRGQRVFHAKWNEGENG